jgi:glycosyltransferase involved in cell wall biosynthesis
LNNTGTLIGGAEIQQKILSDSLAEKDWNISFVTKKYDNGKPIKINSNITIFPVLNFTDGNKYIIKLFVIPIALWRILGKINVDIYYQRDTNYMAGIVAIFCKLFKKRFVLAAANNWNFDKGNEKNLNDPLDRISAFLGIKLADKIIVQNMDQMRMLFENYNRKGNLFYNTFPKVDKHKAKKYILWVGRLERHKRPQMFLELAELLPQYNFLMVGGKGSDEKLKQEIEFIASNIKNLTYLGHQPFNLVEDLFDHAYIFISTYNPSTEGFPNTFLQAWSRGIPVVSSMDIDSLISSHRLGVIAKTTFQLRDAVDKIMKNNEFTKNSIRIKKFFETNFSVKTKIIDFERILTE